MEASLYDLIFQVIGDKIAPVPVIYSPWTTEKKTPPKINILQILDAFKLPLLEDYCDVLALILSKY